MTASSVTIAQDILASFAVPERPLYLVGIFERGVTVYSQQIRALNLIWALVETGALRCKLKPRAPYKGERASVAIIGGGFAGLTAAAALIKKGVYANITIFEHRDTLLPLQHGSDTRWLHPRIYNWPAEDSDSAVADLPILNWTAARASDVAAQILPEWRDLAEPMKKDLFVFCNAQHLQIHERKVGDPGLTIEWVGERRNHDGSVSGLNASIGETKMFDHVILAVGYGLEKDNALSYWRNDTLGQPSLAEPHRTYLVSGQGDGAMIEVLRLRISQYRQDRILQELLPNLPKSVRELQEKYPEPAPGIFAAFEELEKEPEFKKAREELTRRLRRDTEVILRLRKRTIVELFEDKDLKIAFQNRLLIYLLYKSGGFVPTCAEIDEVVKVHGIPNGQVIRRHGAQWKENLTQLLSETLDKEVKEHFRHELARQSNDIRWRGGYFGFPGSEEAAQNLGDKIREEWRKEYLPGPTALAALSLCTAIGGSLLADHPPDKRLRITLHRTRMVGPEALLQQCCEYVGTSIKPGRLAAGRTFAVENATIGLSYRCREIVRSAKGVSPQALRKAMSFLALNLNSRRMSRNVGFVMAIPIVQPETVGAFSGHSPVAGILYIDSEASGYFIDNKGVKSLRDMVERFVRDASDFGLIEFRRIRNRSSGKEAKNLSPRDSVPANVASVLKIVSEVGPPRTTKPFQLNFDYVDFVPA
jgi:hypothetical protein